MLSMRLIRLLASLTLAATMAAAPAAKEPAGDARDPQRDVTRFVATTDAGTLSAEVEVAQPWDFANVQLLIDTDGNPKTGVRVESAPQGGFDVMVEGATVYRFKGDDPAIWEWREIGLAQRSVKGATMTVDVAADVLDAWRGELRVVLRTLTADWKTVIDTVPDAGFATASVPAGGADARPPTEAERDAEDAERDLLSVWARQDGGDLVITVKTRGPGAFDTALVFLDTDANPETGFQPPADPRHGFEMLVSGPSLQSHAGETRDAWAWKIVAEAQRSAGGDTLEYRFDAAALKTGKADKLGVGVFMMAADWQALVDQAPDRGLYPVKIDKTKIKPATRQARAVPMAEPRANRDLPPRQRVEQARSYYCYYGAGRVAELSHYDIAILHTPMMAAANVKTLNDLGVVTVGYVTVGEDDQLRAGDGKGPGGMASWYFDKDRDGQPDKNGVWNSWYANAADPLWRADRVAEARRMFDDYGFAGVFLDTIEVPDVYPESRDGMIELVAELRRAFPDKVIVINRGFSLLKEDAVSSVIDAVMFESFTVSYDFETKRYIEYGPQDLDFTRQQIERAVMPAIRKHAFKVLALDYCQPEQTDRIQKAFDRAVTFGFLPAVAPIHLDDVYDTAGIVGKPDLTYLADQSTPENLAHTMAEARNGFPKGTVLTPSSTYLGYSVAALVDGIEDRGALHWSKANWASAEGDDLRHELHVRLGSPTTGGRLRILWANDNGRWHASKAYRVEVKADPNAGWELLAEETANARHDVSYPLPATPIAAIRIVQSPGGGGAARPGLMWVAQLERVD
jgi:hypothetical protein